MASRIYAHVKGYFPDLSPPAFDAAYRRYIGRILRVDGRREFDLASMELLAALHDGHTWFHDSWLDESSGQPVGFIAYPIAKRWTVVRSLLESIDVGDVIVAIDGTPIEDFFARNRKYVSASSDRDAGLGLFDTPAIFPDRFQLALAGGRTIIVDRKNGKRKPAPVAGTEGRWLTRGVAYIKVPTFRGIETQAQAIAYLKQFRDARAVMVDVRGNPGGGYPVALKEALINQPYRAWTQSNATTGGDLVRTSSPTYPQRATTTTSEAVIRPRDPVHAGRLILLIDRGCTSGCEDFVMPFKTARLATLVGETTGGTFSDTASIAFDNGMRLNVAAVRHSFPDGSRFEGVGIAPDLPVATTAEDLKASRDPVLHRALQIASSRSDPR